MMFNKIIFLTIIGAIITCCGKVPEDNSPTFNGSIDFIRKGNYQFDITDVNHVVHYIQLASINGLEQNYSTSFYLSSIKLMADLCDKQSIKFVNQEAKYINPIYTDSKQKMERGVLYCQNQDIAEVYLKNGFADAEVQENFSQSYFKIQQTAKDQKLGIWANN